METIARLTCTCRGMCCKATVIKSTWHWDAVEIKRGGIRETAGMAPGICGDLQGTDLRSTQWEKDESLKKWF